MQSYLQYGDLLIFEHSKFKNEKIKKGYISGTGFVDKHVYLSQSRNYLPFNKANELIPLNYRSFVFQITPKLHFDYHKDYDKAKKLYNEAVAKQKNSKKKNIIGKDFYQKKLQKLDKKMAEEKNLNEKLIEKCSKNYIYYGSEIQLMHYDSKSFISGKNNYERNDMIGYNCELLDTFLSTMVFQILPKFKTHHIGDKIHYQDTIYLKNCTFNAFLNFKEESEENEYFYEQISPMLANHNWVDSRFEKKKLFLSSEKECVFTLKLFKKNFSSNHFVFSFDYVTLEHTELQAFLTADRKYENEKVFKEFVFLRKYFGEIKEEEFNLDSIWIIEPSGTDFVSKKIEVSSYLKVNKDIERMKLRHFSTGKILNFIKINDKYFPVLEEKDENSLIDFKSLENNSFLLNSNLYYISMKENNFNFNTLVDDSINFKGEEVETYLKEKNNYFKFSVLEPEEIGVQKKGIILLPFENQENVFKIEKIDELQIKKILFVKSGILKLRLFLEKFKKKNLLKDIDIEKAKTLLEIIIRFIFNLDETTIIDYFSIQLDPIQTHQKLLRDIHFIDILIEIFYFAFTKYKIQNIKNNHLTLESNDLLLNFMKMSFSAMRYSIGEYRPNELYASQWLDFLMTETLNTKENSDTLIGLTLTELIDNNTRILETRIKKDIIEKIIQGMDFKNKNLYFIGLLKAICICNEIPMFLNQKITTELLLNENKFKIVGFRFFESGGNIFIRNSKYNFEESLSEIDNKQRSQENKKIYRYIINFCELISNLCKERNYSAIGFAQKKFPKQILLQIIKEYQYNFEIREVVLDMFENIWMDREPYQFKENPSVLLLMDDFIEENQFQRKQTNNYDSSFEGLRTYFWNFLDNMFYTKNINKINFIIKVIDTIIKMINIGFINKIEHFQNLIEMNLKVINMYLNPNRKRKYTVLAHRENELRNDDNDFYKKTFFTLYIKIFELFIVIIKFSVSSHYNVLIKAYREQFLNNKKDNSLIKSRKIHKNNDLKKFTNLYTEHIAKKDLKTKILKDDQLEILIYMILDFFIETDDKDLLTTCLKLLNALFHQNEFFINFFDEISIIYSKEHYDIYLNLRDFSKKLFKKIELVGNWYNKDRINEIEPLMDDINIFLEQKKEIVFEIEIDDFSKELIKFLTIFNNSIEFEHIQKIFNHLNILQNLFKILRYDTHYYKEKKIDLSKTLNQIYKIILFYQKNNKFGTKFICKNYFSLINLHFERKIFYPLVLLNELLRNNQELIFNEKKNSILIKNVLKLLEDPKQIILAKVFALQIVNSFIDFKGYKIKQYQTFFALKLFKNDLFKNIKEFLQEIINSKKENFYRKIVFIEESNKIIVKSPENNNKKKEEIYFMDKKYNLFTIMIKTINNCIEKNMFVKNLCQGLFDIKSFIEIYSQLDFKKCLPIKYSMLIYLKNVLLSNEENEYNLFENLGKIWEILRTDYKNLIGFLNDYKHFLDKILITYEKFVTVKKLFEDYFNMMLNCLSFIIETYRYRNEKTNLNTILNIKNTVKDVSEELDNLLLQCKIDNKRHVDFKIKIENFVVIHKKKKKENCEIICKKNY